MNLNKKQIRTYIFSRYILILPAFYFFSLIIYRIYYEEQKEILLFPIVVFLIWPHLSHVILLLLSNYKKNLRFAKLHSLLDSLFLGLAVYICSFNLFLTLTVLFGIITLSYPVEGFILTTKCIFAFFIGTIALLPFIEFSIQYESSFITSLICLTASLFQSTFLTLNLYKIIKKTQKNKNELKNFNLQINSELEFAKMIQKNYLPEKCPLNNISAFYKPIAQVGGDFYDFIHFETNDKIGIFISDVSGHGVPAAFITSMLKTIILQPEVKKNDPAEFLFYMNEVLCKQIKNKFITALYGIYDPRERTFIYANSGHNKPYLIHDEVKSLQGERMSALSMFPNGMLTQQNKHYVNNKEDLPMGSKLLLYTDGLTETRPFDGEEFFEDSKMHDVFIKNKSLSNEFFIKNLYQELITFRGRESFEDDICLICIHVK